VQRNENTRFANRLNTGYYESIETVKLSTPCFLPPSGPLSSHSRRCRARGAVATAACARSGTSAPTKSSAHRSILPLPRRRAACLRSAVCAAQPGCDPVRRSHVLSWVHRAGLPQRGWWPRTCAEATHAAATYATADVSAACRKFLPAPLPRAIRDPAPAHCTRETCSGKSVFRAEPP